MKNIHVKAKSSLTIIDILLVFFLILIFLIFWPYNKDLIYRYNYVIDGFCFITIILLLMKYKYKNGFDIFDPIYIISAIYGTMYFITPMYDILNEELYWYGYSLFPYGVKASIIIILGYIAFYIAYTVNIFKKKYKVAEKKKQIKNVRNGTIICSILVVYLVSFIANAVYMVKYYGGDLLYFLTLGLLGSSGVAKTNAPIGFISMLSYCLPTATLLYFEYGNNKIMKIVLFVPMIMLQISRGFRFFIVQILIMFFSYYYIRKDKRPKIFSILCGLVIITIPILFMTLFREALRDGNMTYNFKVDGELISNALNAAIWDNFRIYQNFYGMINAIPTNFSYVYGRQIIIGTLVMVIPRFLWPGKISTYGGVGLKTLIGPRIAEGQAYPNVGEFYYAFGIVGVIGFMLIYGFWMKKVRLKYMSKSKGALSNMTFSILLASNLQLIIRGYTPSNFWFIIFSLIPIWIVQLVSRTKYKK